VIFVKNKRHECILNIIAENEITTQQSLLCELQKKGFNTTQATLSRDIKQLGLIKISGRYARGMPENDNMPNIAEIITDIKYAMHTIIVKTMPGTAPLAGSIIDAMNDSAIIGSVAGDDTVLVICKDPGSAASGVRKIGKLFNYEKGEF